MAIEVFIVESSEPHVSVILTQPPFVGQAFLPVLFVSGCYSAADRQECLSYAKSSSQDAEDMTVCQGSCYIAVGRELLPCEGGFSGQWLRMRGCEDLAYLFFAVCRTRR